jgi:hypothetical protein
MKNYRKPPIYQFLEILLTRIKFDVDINNHELVKPYEKIKWLILTGQAQQCRAQIDKPPSLLPPVLSYFSNFKIESSIKILRFI